MNDSFYTVIFTAAGVTALIRLVLIFFLSQRRFPALLRDFLSFVPVAILSAIIAGEIMGAQKTTSFGLPVALVAAACTLVVGILSRSLFATVLASILAFQNL